METLKLDNIHYSYKGAAPVLKGINQTFEQGKVYAIIGPSGSGKTTLLSLLGGMDSPTEGNILADGTNIETKGLQDYRKNKVSFVFQHFNLLDYLTAAENVRLTAKVSPIPILEKVGLTPDQAKRKVVQLSGGQQQRVAIARALVSEAKILLADEPTGNLDEETASGIVELLKETAHVMNKCVIIVTHSHDLAREADEVFLLKQGLLHEVKMEGGTRNEILPTGT